MDTQLKLQYAQGVITVVLGVLGCFLPQRWNPFRPKDKHRQLIPEKVALRLPRIIGVLCIFTGVVVLVLTPFLGPMPWK